MWNINKNLLKLGRGVMEFKCYKVTLRRKWMRGKGFKLRQHQKVKKWCYSWWKTFRKRAMVADKTCCGFELTWLLPQSHDGHDIVRHVKVGKHGQVCQPVGQFVQVQHLQQIHYLSSYLSEPLSLIPVKSLEWRKGNDPVQSIWADRRFDPPSVRHSHWRPGVNRCQVAHSWGDDFRDCRSTDQYHQRMVRLCCPMKEAVIGAYVGFLFCLPPYQRWGGCTHSGFVIGQTVPRPANQLSECGFARRRYKICKRYQAAARPPFMSGKYHQTST